MTRLSMTESIETRHSIRRYRPDPVPVEDLREIIRLARLAPSAWNLQPWRFHVVTDPAVKKQIEEAADNQYQVVSAPAVIIVCSDMEDTLDHFEEVLPDTMSPERKQREIGTVERTFRPKSVEWRANYGLSQTNIALGFLLLAARGMGYSTVPMLGFDRGRVREVLGLPEHVKFAAMVPIGIADEEGYPHFRHDVDRITKFY